MKKIVLIMVFVFAMGFSNTVNAYILDAKSEEDCAAQAWEQADELNQ